MNKLRVARMPYLNSDVFYRGFEGKFELRPLVPRAMAWAIENREIDAGPLPVVEWFRMERDLAPVGDFCVATGKAAISILLYCKVPAAELSGRRIAVTEHTSTSVQLLRVLLAERWNAEGVELVAPETPTDALLLIGDLALKNRHGVDGFPHMYDLGAVWHEHTGLPFVFARWVARRDADASQVAELEQALGRSLADGLRNIDALAAASSVGLSPAEAAAYVRSFTYRMGPDQRSALAAFRARLEQLPEWRPASPGVWAGRRG